MPVRTGKDGDTCFAQWGQSGKKYEYACGDADAEGKAKRKAYLQGIAAEKNGAKATESDMEFSPRTFAQDTGISEKMASRILELLYKKELTADDFSAILWRIRDWFIQNKMPALVEKLSDDEVNAVIDQLIADRAMWQSQVPHDVCCARSASELEEAFNSIGLPEAAWFFTAMDFKDAKEHKAGDIVRIQVMRTGTWQHQDYGEVKIDKKVIRDVVANFKNNTRGVDLAVDENHEPDHKALGWFKDLVVENDGNDLFADIELTKKGAEILNEGLYKYFSPEIVFHKVDEETGDPQSNLLIGGAFTNRPFFKDMVPLMASEGATPFARSGTAPASPEQAIFFHHSTMKKFLELMAKLVSKEKIDASEKAELEQAYGAIANEDRSEAINKAFAETLAKFDEPAEETPEQKKAREDAAAAAAAEAGGEGGQDGVTDDAAPAPVPQGVDGVKANEDGTFTITDTAKFSESVKGIQKLAGEMTRAKTLSECEKSVTPLMFSEKNKTNVVLPKSRKAIVEFAASLSKEQRATFFKIVGELKSVPATETGHGKDPATPDPMKPETYTAEDPAVKHFMEKFQQDLPTAQKSAANFYAEKARRK